MTLSDLGRIRCANIDLDTGKVLTHAEVYDRYINKLGGLEAVKPYVPFSLKQIRRALQSDPYLNNLSMRRWDYASGFYCKAGSATPTGGGLWHLYRQYGVDSASNAQGVCILKRAAVRMAEEESV